MTEAHTRLDKWLWHARFCKTRGRAAALCEAGLLILNGRVVQKPAHSVKPGDQLVIPRGDYLITVEVVALGYRRGPHSEAAALYREPDASQRRRLPGTEWASLLDDDTAL